MTDSKYLMKYIIPKSLKKEFKSNLSDLGVDYRTLFPDLDGLAKTIKEGGEIVGWNQPNPLFFR